MWPPFVGPMIPGRPAVRKREMWSTGQMRSPPFRTRAPGARPGAEARPRLSNAAEKE